MLNQDYYRTNSDHYIFIKRFFDDNFIIHLFYVDDMIDGHDASKIDILKREHNKSFAMKHLGPTKQIFSMKISRDRQNRRF